jgi:Flp pilus assembly pilin Flp
MSGDQCRGEASTGYSALGAIGNRTSGATAVPAGGAEPRKECRQMLDLIQTKALVFLAGLKNDREEGQALVEYALILSLIAVVSIAVLTGLGKNVSGILHSISAAL